MVIRPWALAVTEKDEQLDIDIYDSIGEVGGLFAPPSGVSAKAVLEKIRGSKTAKATLVRINSMGGLLDDAKAIHNLLREQSAEGKRVKVRIDGLAASAAGVVAAAGDEITIAKNGFYMVHEARVGTGGTADAHRRAADVLTKADDQLAEMYADCAKKRGKAKTTADFRKAMKAETYFTAKEALEWGLVDAIGDEVKVTAYAADVTGITRAPEELLLSPYVIGAPNTATPPITLDEDGIRRLAAALRTEPWQATPPAGGRSDQSQAHRGEEGKRMTFAIIAKALNLPDSAEEAAIVAAISGLNDRTHTALRSVGEYETLTGLTGRESVGAVAAWKEQAAQVPTLQKELTERQAAEIKARVQAMLNDAKDKGLVSEAELASLQSMGEKDPEWLRGNLTARSPIIVTRQTALQHGDDQTSGDSADMQLTNHERRVARQAGLSYEDFLAEKKLRAQEARARKDEEEEDE